MLNLAEETKIATNRSLKRSSITQDLCNRLPLETANMILRVLKHSSFMFFYPHLEGYVNKLTCLLVCLVKCVGEFDDYLVSLFCEVLHET